MERYKFRVTRGGRNAIDRYNRTAERWEAFAYEGSRAYSVARDMAERGFASIIRTCEDCQTEVTAGLSYRFCYGCCQTAGAIRMEYVPSAGTAITWCQDCGLDVDESPAGAVLSVSGLKPALFGRGKCTAGCSGEVRHVVQRENVTYRVCGLCVGRDVEEIEAAEMAPEASGEVSTYVYREVINGEVSDGVRVEASAASLLEAAEMVGAGWESADGEPVAAVITDGGRRVDLGDGLQYVLAD